MISNMFYDMTVLVSAAETTHILNGPALTEVYYILVDIHN